MNFSSEKLFLTFEIALSCILVKSFLSIVIDCLIAIDKACGSLGLTLKPVKLLPFLIVGIKKYFDCDLFIQPFGPITTTESRLVIKKNPTDKIYDLNDYKAMKSIGLKMCPIDAEKRIVDCCDIVFQKKGGHGVIRELYSMITGD